MKLFQDLSTGSFAEWEETEAEVSKIYIYPQKSAKGIRVEEANVIISFLSTLSAAQENIQSVASFERHFIPAF